MDQAVNGSIPQSAIDQPAAIPASPFTITALGQRYAQLADAHRTRDTDEQFSDEQEALEALMICLDPKSLDEALTLGDSICTELDVMTTNAELRGYYDVSCRVDKVRQLARIMKAICCGLRRHGAKNLRMASK